MSGLSSESVILVTGASGFLGHFCLEQLIKSNCVIHAVNRHGDGPNSSRVWWHGLDLRDPDAASVLIRTVRPTHLLHVAWIATPGRFWQDPDNLNWLKGGISLLCAFGHYGGQRFVGVGSCAEYDWKQSRFVEDETPLLPNTLYGNVKVSMAFAAASVAMRYGFSAAWGRVFLPYGPSDTPGRLVPTVINSLVAGEPIELTMGTQERDFIFAPDAANLLVTLLACDLNGFFNIGTGRGTTVRQVVESLADRLGGRELLKFGVLKNNEPPRLVADIQKVFGRLGWLAPTTLEKGLDMVIESALGER